MSQDQVNHPVEEDNDDLPVGRVLSRREVLALFGLAGTSMLAACTVVLPNTPNAESATAIAIADSPTAQATQAAEVATVEAVNTVVPSCVVRPEMTEGPYFVDVQLERADIREGKEGMPLTLAINLAQITGATCSPLEGATVDIWHCDALGVYSGVTDPGFDTSDELWLRGYQVTDANGRVEFTTIYPGWYSGRAVHIHFKIRTSVTGNETYEFTSQFFFDESLSDQIFTQAPYSAKGQRDTFNSTDSIYSGGGEMMLLNLTPINGPINGNGANGGYATTFDIALDLSDTETGASDAAGQGGGPGGGGRPGGPPPGGTPPVR